MFKYCCLIIFFLLSSCRDAVDETSINHNQVPVLNAWIKEGNPITVHASLTNKLNSMQIHGANNATVELFANGLFIERLENSGSGWFQAETIAEFGNTYTCKLMIPGFDIVNASTFIPFPSGLMDIQHISIAGKDRHGDTYPAIRFTFENKINRELYFEVRIRLIQNDNESLAMLKNIVDPILLNEGLPLTLFSNELIGGDHYSMVINYSTGISTQNGNGKWVTVLYPMILELRSVSKDYYQFTRQKYLYETGRFPEFGLGANIAFPLHSNVEGGYGIVAGFSTVVSDTIYPSY